MGGSSTARSVSSRTSPVIASFSFATAPMSPSPNASACVVILALHAASSWPKRSFACVRVLTSVESAVIVPLRTRKTLMRPGERVGDRLEDERGRVRAVERRRGAPFFAGRRHALDEQVEERRRAEVLRRDRGGDREDLAARDGVLERVRRPPRRRAPGRRGSAPSGPRRSRRRRRGASRGTRPTWSAISAGISVRRALALRPRGSM